ncbi:MAG: hypothetical protein WD872_01130 [Pirellulaceae bacterium]
MFSADDIYQRIKGRPFVPIRVRTSDGQSFDVYHPDLVIVGRRFVMIGTASSESPAHAELITRVSVIHITSLEDLPVPIHPGGNGQSG